MPDDAPAASSSSGGGAPAPFEPSVELISQITGMGFSENGAKRACEATNNADAETAMNWVFAHMEDPGFNDPWEATPAGGGAPASGSAGGSSGSAEVQYDPEQVLMLTSMGFSEDQVKFALKSTSNNAERAADYLLTHIGELDALMAADAAGAGAAAGGAAGGGAASSSASQSQLDDGPGGNYSLVGFVSHIGKNTSSGHYVAHIFKDGKWVIFDDEKVAASANPPFEYGYVYCFKRG